MLLADRIVVLTDLYLIQMKATFKSLLRSKKIVIIQNGIDLDFFYPVDKNAPCKQLVIGMAARFTPSKKQDFLVSVLERIYELEPNINLKLTFAGNGTELNRVKRIAESSSVARNITFEGLIEEKQIAPWMRNLDIYVHATEGETLSTSILQSMGCGIPIIASDVTGVANLLGHQNNLGYCIINDKDSFAKAIIKLLKDPHDQSRIANNVRKHAELYFGNTEMLNRYIKLIRSII
jgi:glycosyltransferase involved in cell wall biosynthesis